MVCPEEAATMGGVAWRDLTTTPLQLQHTWPNGGQILLATKLPEKTVTFRFFMPCRTKRGNVSEGTFLLALLFQVMKAKKFKKVKFGS